MEMKKLKYCDSYSNELSNVSRKFEFFIHYWDYIFKYPNAQIKLVGYANDARLPLTNKTLSVKRVFTLKDMFVKAGISYVRVDAEGRGTGINPKDTTGRRQAAMREVWVKFVQK